MRSALSAVASASGMMKLVIKRQPRSFWVSATALSASARASSCNLTKSGSPLRHDALAPVIRSTASLHVIGVAGDRIDHGDLLNREVGDDLDLLLVHDQHLFDAHPVTEALAVLGLERKRHSGLDLDRVIERPDARDHRRVVLRKPQTMAP